MQIVRFVVVGQQNTQPVLDGYAGRRDQKAVRELRAHAMPRRVDGLPGDYHGHDGRLASTGRKLQRYAVEILVRRIVGKGELLKDLLAACRGIGDFREPDKRLHGLHLAEERADVREVVAVAPVPEEPCSLCRDAPFFLRHFAPFAYFVSNVVYEVIGRICRIVYSIFRLREKVALILPTFHAAVNGDGRLQTGWATKLVDVLGRQIVRVHLPMPPWIFIGRIENWIQCKIPCIRNRLFHIRPFLPRLFRREHATGAAEEERRTPKIQFR